MNTTNVTPETRAALRIVAVVGEAIEEAKEIPSGHLYAALMGQMTLDQYNKIIQILKNAKCVEEDSSHLLRWIGPSISPKH